MKDSPLCARPWMSLLRRKEPQNRTHPAPCVGECPSTSKTRSDMPITSLEIWRCVCFLMPSLYICIAVLLAVNWFLFPKLQWCQWVLQKPERLDAHHIWPSWTGFVWFYIALKSARTYLNINTSLTHLTTFHHVHLASI